MIRERIRTELLRILKNITKDKQKQPLVTYAARLIGERRNLTSNERFFRAVKNEIISRSNEDDIYIDSPQTATMLDFLPEEGIILVGTDNTYGKTYRSGPHVRYLCGTNPDGIWIRKFYKKISTIEEAFEFITPFEVIKAKENGMKVLRQSGVWAIQTDRDYATTSAQRCGRKWDKTTRTLYHVGENSRIPPLVVPFKCKFYRQLASKL